MNIKIVLLFFFFFGVICEYEFFKTFGETKNDKIEGIAEDEEGNFYFVGDVGGNEVNLEHEMLLSKWSKKGKHIWSKKYGINYKGGGNSIALTKDNIFVLGRHIHSTDHQLGLSKFSIEGDLIWTKLFDGSKSKGFHVIKASDNSLVIVGKHMPDSENFVYFSKISTDGEIIFAHSIAGIANDFIKRIAETQNGFLLSGYSNSRIKNGGNNMLLVKTNQLGEKIWAKDIGIYQGGISQYGYDVLEIDDGFLIAGETDWKAAIVKLGPDGSFIWGKTINQGVQHHEAHKVVVLDGNIFIVGIRPHFQFSTIIFVAKLESNGDLVWVKGIGENNALSKHHYISDAIKTKDNQLLIVGSSLSTSSNSRDALIIKINSNGEIVDTCTNIFDLTQEFIFEDVTFQSEEASLTFTDNQKTFFDVVLEKNDYHPQFYEECINPLPSCSSSNFKEPYCDECANDLYSFDDNCNSCKNANLGFPECNQCINNLHSLDDDCSSCKNDNFKFPECKECIQGYIGSQCSIMACGGIAANEKQSCSVNGTCVGPETCDCDSNRRGKLCQFKIVDGAECEGISSRNDSVCSSSGSCIANETCSCLDGYSGVICEVPESTNGFLDFLTPTNIGIAIAIAVSCLLFCIFIVFASICITFCCINSSKKKNNQNDFQMDTF